MTEKNIGGICSTVVYTPARHVTTATENLVDLSSAPEVPEPWASRLVARGFTDRRGAGGRPSISALADRCQVHPTTISSAINGGPRKTSAETARRIVEALGPDVADWLGVPRTKEWAPPASAVFLTARQRRAVEELINAMTEQQQPAAAPPASAAPAVELVGRRAARRGTPAYAGRDETGEDNQDPDPGHEPA